MSRIVRAPVSAGQTITATDLNNTYSDYNQPGALNADNTRDQAFDLPHFTNVQIIKNSKVDILGNTGMLHAAPVTTYSSDAASPPGLHPVQNSVGNQTVLSFGASGWSFVAGDCLRVWWNLSLITNFVGEPPNTAGVMGRYTIADDAAGTVVLTDGFHCWLAYLQWDITSNALTNFVAVPGQMDPATNIAGSTYDGFYVQNLNAGTTFSPWSANSSGFGYNGTMPAGNNGAVTDHYWYAPYGMYVTPFIAPVTVYGVRVVITGLLHPFHLPGGNQENLLVYDYAIGGLTPAIEYKGGRISAVQMRVS